MCGVQKSQKVKRLEVTVDCGAEESVWPAKLLQEIPTVLGEEVSGGKWSGDGPLWPKEDQVRRAV